MLWHFKQNKEYSVKHLAFLRSFEKLRPTCTHGYFGDMGALTVNVKHLDFQYLDKNYK